MSADATQLLSSPDWSDPGIHLLDDTWLLTIFAVLLATALPWLLSGFDVNFLAASLGLLVLGAVHFGFSMLGRRIVSGDRRGILTALHVIGVFTVGFIWINVGGLQNPAFLIVFALPVVGAIFLSRWQPYAMAVLAILLASAVALAQIPELRWYEPSLGTIGAWLGRVLNTESSSAAPFRGFYAPSSYYVVLLQVFDSGARRCRGVGVSRHDIRALACQSRRRAKRSRKQPGVLVHAGGGPARACIPCRA